MLTVLCKTKNYHQGMLKKYLRTLESGSQTSLVSATSAFDKDPNETLVESGNGAIGKIEEKVEVPSRSSATHRGRKNLVLTTRIHLEDARLTK